MTTIMLNAALIAFALFMIAGLFGFTGVIAAAADAAKFLFLVFVVLLTLALAGDRRAK